MPTMKGQIDTVEDDFWTEHIELFTAQFPSYYTKPQKVQGRFHTSEEKYSASAHEIIPISEKQGKRTYVMMQELLSRVVYGGLRRRLVRPGAHP
jgi:hypothetical protein